MPVGYLNYGDDHPDLVEQFSAKAADQVGSLTLTGTATYTDAGVLVGATATDSSTLLWDTSFCNTANDFHEDGYTLQFELEKSFFIETLAAAGIIALMDGSTNSRWQRNGGTEGLNFYHGGTRESRAQTLDEGIDTHVKVTLSWNPDIGAYGQFDCHLNHMLFSESLLDAAQVDLSQLYISGAGTGGLPNTVARIRNVMLFTGATTLAGVNEKRYTVIGDSWTNYGQYTKPNGTTDAPALIAYAGVEYGANLTDGRQSYKNRSFFAEMHNQLYLEGFYPQGNRINFYGLGGSYVDSTKTNNDLMDRWLSLVAPTNSTYPTYPAPVSGIGPNVGKILHIHAGTNDIGYSSESDADRLDDLKAVIDLAVQDGTELILVDTVPTRWASGPGAQIDAAETLSWNALVVGLSGYREVVRIVDLYPHFTTAHSTTDGIHPSAEGQVLWAKLAGAEIRKFYGGAGSGSMAGSIIGGNIIGRL